MIKRIIFDIDDTLIKFPRHYFNEYQNLLDKLDIDISFNQLYDVIDKYEECGKYLYYDKDELIKLINSELNLNLDESFCDKFFLMYDKLITPVSDSVKDTLKYLSSKYELVTLSNWFTKSQVNRLEYAGILKYFNKVYGADIVCMKPNKECFDSVVDNYKYDECLMVGNNLDIDIKVPYEMGINVYYLTNEESNYPTIKSISDLKEML